MSFQCTFCNKTFKTSRNLERHNEKYCKKIGEIQCPDCLLYYREGSLLQHEKLQFHLNAIKCEYCNAIIQNSQKDEHVLLKCPKGEVSFELLRNMLTRLHDELKELRYEVESLNNHNYRDPYTPDPY